MSGFRERVFRAGVLMLAHLMRRPRSGNVRTEIVVLTPTACGSLGDEAMVRAAVGLISTHLQPPGVTLLTWDEKDAEVLGDLSVRFCQIGRFLSLQLGLRNAIRPLREARQLIAVLDRAERVFVLGADVLDGKYSETRSLRRMFVADLAQRRGAAAALAGFSFSDRATAATRAALQRLPGGVRLACREPHSAARVTEITGRDVEANADLAFLLMQRPPGSTDHPRLQDAIRTRREAGRQIVAVNLNRQAFAHSDAASIDRIVARYEAALQAVARAADVSFVFIPHDYRGPHSDEILLRRIAGRLGGALDVLMPQDRLGADGAKWLAGLSDLTVTGRMHLAIASLGAGVPAFVQDYQGKVTGLLSLFDLQEMRFTEDDLAQPDDFARRVCDALCRNKDLRARIAGALPEIRRRSTRNIIGPGED